jgi:hypothetical protein
MRVLAAFGLLAPVILVVGACAADPPAPPPGDTATQVVPSATQPAPDTGRPVVVGGYSAASATDAMVQAAEKLAIDEIYKREPQRSIVETVTREQQVVAGMNYRFNVKMSGVNRYEVVVFRSLQGEMSVTGFTKLAG